jgi:hypothetical protein
MFEDALMMVGKDDHLYVMISPPGGDGETALRIYRTPQPQLSWGL